MQKIRVNEWGSPTIRTFISGDKTIIIIHEEPDYGMEDLSGFRASILVAPDQIDAKETSLDLNNLEDVVFHKKDNYLAFWYKECEWTENTWIGCIETSYTMMDGYTATIEVTSDGVSNKEMAMQWAGIGEEIGFGWTEEILEYNYSDIVEDEELEKTEEE